MFFQNLRRPRYMATKSYVKNSVLYIMIMHASQLMYVHNRARLFWVYLIMYPSKSAIGRVCNTQCHMQSGFHPEGIIWGGGGGGGGSSRKWAWLYIFFYTTVPNFGGEASPPDETLAIVVIFLDLRSQLQ